jgi:hypothetical protein
MKAMYERYPEILFVDTTYCLNNIKYPALAMVVQDEDGHSYPVCIIIIAYERNALLDECFQMFVENNPESVGKTVAIMIDKDLKEDDMLSKNFPKARILYCVWHVLKSFKKNFSKKSEAFRLLQRMSYSMTLEEYNKHLIEFEKIASCDGLKYFKDNWECCLEKWVKYHRIGLKIRDNNTNNAVESINNQFKSFVGKNQRISVCLERIFAYLTFAFNKYDYKRVISLTRKSRYNSNSSDSNVAKFFELTNKKNAEWLALQFELSEINYDVNIVKDFILKDIFLNLFCRFFC